jgi:hypothetical protein
LANYAINEEGTEAALLKYVPNLQNTKRIKQYPGSLFCTEVKENEVLSLQVQMLFYITPVHIAITQANPHILSAVCRSTQFVPSINNVVSDRCYRPASCTVDVDWLKFWVQLVVRGKMNTT